MRGVANLEERSFLDDMEGPEPDLDADLSWTKAEDQVSLQGGRQPQASILPHDLRLYTASHASVLPLPAMSCAFHLSGLPHIVAIRRAETWRRHSPV